MGELDAAMRAIAERQHGLVTVEQVAALGGTHRRLDHRIARGEWERYGLAVLRLVGAPRAWRQRLHAALLAAGLGAVASHQSAARLDGLPAFGEGPVVLTKEGPASYRTPGATIHRTRALPTSHVTTVDGIPTTVPARTVFDCLAGMHVKRAGRLLDTALAMDLFPLRAFADVYEEVGGRGVSGSANARALLEERGVGYVPPESELEALLIGVLTAAGLPAPARQVWLGREYGITGRVDFVYREARVVIEADSRRYHSSFTDAERDRWRDNELAVQGWRVLRVTWWQLKRRPDEFVALVHAALRGTSTSN
jgi:hypothetical protein